jgi:hypothetical protein
MARGVTAAPMNLAHRVRVRILAGQPVRGFTPAETLFQPAVSYVVARAS